MSPLGEVQKSCRDFSPLPSGSQSVGTLGGRCVVVVFGRRCAGARVCGGDGFLGAPASSVPSQFPHGGRARDANAGRAFVRVYPTLQGYAPPRRRRSCRPGPASVRSPEPLGVLSSGEAGSTSAGRDAPTTWSVASVLCLAGRNGWFLSCRATAQKKKNEAVVQQQRCQLMLAQRSWACSFQGKITTAPRRQSVVKQALAQEKKKAAQSFTIFISCTNHSPFSLTTCRMQKCRIHLHKLVLEDCRGTIKKGEHKVSAPTKKREWLDSWLSPVRWSAYFQQQFRLSARARARAHTHFQGKRTRPTKVTGPSDVLFKAICSRVYCNLMKPREVRRRGLSLVWHPCQTE